MEVLKMFGMMLLIGLAELACLIGVLWFNEVQRERVRRCKRLMGTMEILKALADDVWRSGRR